jgi:DNA-binding HxlR family transcriptional regulator
MLLLSTMAKRSYKQNCALALAGDVMGERWSLLLVRDLLVGPRRYGELARSLKGIGTNLLAARLKELEKAGIVERRQGDNGVQVYALSERGRALEPAILALIRWGMVYGPENQEGFYHQNDWDLLALKALFQPAGAAALSSKIQFRSAHFTGWMSIDKLQIEMGLGEIQDADAIVRGTVSDLFTGPNSPDTLLESGSLPKLESFMSTFALRV